MATEIRERAETGTLASAEQAGRPLSVFLRGQTRKIGASFHLLFRPDGTQRGGCILTSNWVYDAVAELGLEAIAQIALRAAAFPGTSPHGFHPLALAALTGREEIAALAHHGHQELFALALPSGGECRHLLLSSGLPGRIAKDALPRTQMVCCYALSRLAGREGAAEDNPLSARERECLSWVAQGKTTDEIAVILGISINMVNSQIAHAIHKLKAKNRAMAIATAIRRKLI